MKPLCIYHGGCDDGFAAAWVIHKEFGDDIEFYPGVYQTNPPPHEGRDVIFVDFSYKRPVLDAMADKAKSILILDHHKTAADDLADLPKPPPSRIWIDAAWNGALSRNLRMTALFDMDRSGSAMAWDYFIGDPLPRFIEYVQDRDLWRKELKGGDEFTIALRSYTQDLTVWDDLFARGPQAMIKEGEIIQRYYRLRIEELKRHAYLASIGGFPCYISNAPYFAASEVAGELCCMDGADFGACYFEVEANRFQYSLRSRNDFDVSAIARLFGGGGHKNAAGFTVEGEPAHKLSWLKATANE